MEKVITEERMRHPHHHGLPSKSLQNMCYVYIEFDMD